MRSSLLIIINFVLIFTLVLGVLFFVFWRVGIFKKEAELSNNVNLIKERIDFVNNYSFQEISKYLQSLSVLKIEIPDLKPEELGRENLF